MTKPNRGVALVTGASTGIGWATAKALAERGLSRLWNQPRAVAETVRRRHHADVRRDR